MSNCTACKHEGAYVGFNSVECPNKDCQFYTERQYKDWMDSKAKPLEREDTTPMFSFGSGMHRIYLSTALGDVLLVPYPYCPPDQYVPIPGLAPRVCVNPATLKAITGSVAAQTAAIAAIERQACYLPGKR